MHAPRRKVLRVNCTFDRNRCQENAHNVLHHGKPGYRTMNGPLCALAVSLLLDLHRFLDLG